MTLVTVIGMDGRPLAAAAGSRLAEADLVVGAARHLTSVQVPGAAAQRELRHVPTAIEELQAFAGRSVVLASGDPGFFGVVRLLRESGVEVEVHPAVSAVSAAFAAVGLPWDDAQVVSAHGRDLRRAVNVCRARPKVAVLTAPGSGPAELGAALAGLPRRLVIAEHLGMADQRITSCTPEEAASAAWHEPNVVLALGTSTTERGWAWPPPRTATGWALPDEAFEHRDGMVTKAETRAVALGHLGPGLGDLIWDVGCGSGSVGIECARLGAAVVAMDRDRAQCDRTRANARRHAVEVDVRQVELPAALDGAPEPDAVFVGGGGAEVLAACAACGARTVVAGLAAVDRVGGTKDALRAAGYEVGGVALSAGRFTELPDGGTRLAGTNPTFLIWGHLL